MVTRRHFLKGLAVGGSVLALGGGSYAALAEAESVTVDPVNIQLSRLPETFDGFSIAQLSDMHVGPHLTGDGLRAIVKRTNGLKPDLIALTGDFVDSDPLRAPEAADALAELQPRFGTFAVLGNHDHYASSAAVSQSLADAGIAVLHNQAHAIEKGRARLWLSGVDDIILGQPDLAKAIRRIPKNDCNILLAHEPDYVDFSAKFGVDLQLSGHSHGGQVRLPLLGATVLPPLGRKYPMGHYTIANSQLYTNRGVGVSNPPVRLNCPPEITLITLRKKRA